MERLTDKRLALPPRVWQEVTREEARELKEIPVPSMRELYYRLSQIEDILGDEYDLDRLRKLAEADREGRCVVLLCKVGDRVWFTKFLWNYAKQPIPAIVCGIKTFSSSGTFTFMALTDTNNVSRSFINQDIGETVFLTREEAEAALAKIATDCD